MSLDLIFLSITKFMKPLNIIIVGAGLSGLSAAVELEKQGHSLHLIDGSDRVGGRIRSESQKGFILDAGFQVILDSYPEIPTQCLKELKLKGFDKGAHYKSDEEGWQLFNAFAPWDWNKEEWRASWGLFKLLMSSRNDNLSTEQLLEKSSIPIKFQNDFVDPFFRGVFLEDSLATRSSRFQDLLGYFAKGKACLPEKGMEALPMWFEKQLRATKITLNESVKAVDSKSVTLTTGEKLTADIVILAVSGDSLSKLLPDVPLVDSCSTCCDYFSVPHNLIKATSFLWLDGDVDSPINNFCVPSFIQPSYTPEGYHLISATSVGPDFASEDHVKEYLGANLKINVSELESLGRCLIRHALPSQILPPPLKERVREGIFIAGEAVNIPSINDAILSGKQVADIVMTAFSN